jgi:hypothetical protein
VLSSLRPRNESLCFLPHSNNSISKVQIPLILWSLLAQMLRLSRLSSGALKKSRKLQDQANTTLSELIRSPKSGTRRLGSTQARRGQTTLRNKPITGLNRANTKQSLGLGQTLKKSLLAPVLFDISRVRRAFTWALGLMTWRNRSIAWSRESLRLRSILCPPGIEI